MAQLTDLYTVNQFNDTFALGHYARVLDAKDKRTRKRVAFKVLRPEHLPTNDGDPSWEYKAFANEADLLTRLANVPQVVNLLDCGYISSDADAPHEGDILSFGKDAKAFAEVGRTQAGRGWRPYLALENLPRHHNLFYLMKPNSPGVRRRLPSEEALALALQFTDFLKAAHAQGIVYLDHKLEHVYWDGLRLTVIDLNSSRSLEKGSATTAAQIQTDVRNLCIGILYPALTGLSPVQGSLRPQPGNQQAVDARYQEVGQLDFGAEPTLSREFTEVLQRGAAQGYPNAEAFQRDLQAAASRHGWDFTGHYTGAASREARTQLREGLAKVREGQERLREARDLFRDAAVMDGITEDLEDELRRLVGAVNAMLNARVVP